MTAFASVRLAKPAKRGPKPRRPIARRGAHRGQRKPGALVEHGALVLRADRLWALIVRAKSPLCVYCHTRPTAQADHLVSRRYRATRWNTEIGAPLCAGCHRMLTSDSYEHAALGARLLGAGRWQLLNAAKDRGKVDVRLAIIALEAEVRAAGLAAQAVARGLMNEERP